MAIGYLYAIEINELYFLPVMSEYPGSCESQSIKASVDHVCETEGLEQHRVIVPIPQVPPFLNLPTEVIANLV